jgi:hypothetical protein
LGVIGCINVLDLLLRKRFEAKFLRWRELCIHLAQMAVWGKHMLVALIGHYALLLLFLLSWRAISPTHAVN